MTETFTIPSTPEAQPPVDYNAPETPSVEPSLIAGKFKTQDDLIAAYKALESKLGKPTEPTLPTTSQTVETSVDPALAIPDAFDPANPTYVPGLSAQQVMELANKEFAANKTLSDSAYSALAAQGISKEMVSAYIAGQQATAQSQLDAAMATVGGKDKYQTITAWAANNMSDAEIAEYNAAVADPKTRALAMKALQGQYIAANGTAPGSLIAGGTAPVAAAFASKAEMVAAMKDPRYAKDPAYRDSVRAKLANSFL